MSALDSYIQDRIDRVKTQMGATELAFDLLGITLTINGQALHVPAETIRAMSALMGQAESDAVDRLRAEMKAERGPY